MRCIINVVKNHALKVGYAGELLAASVLQRHFKTIAFPQLPTAYDLLVETKSQFLRCQVKTAHKVTTINSNRYFKFSTSFRQTQKYTKDDIDFFALVILPNRVMQFYPPSVGVSVYIKESDATLEKEQASFKNLLSKYL